MNEKLEKDKILVNISVISSLLKYDYIIPRRSLAMGGGSIPDSWKSWKKPGIYYKNLVKKRRQRLCQLKDFIKHNTKVNYKNLEFFELFLYRTEKKLKNSIALSHIRKLNFFHYCNLK